MAVGIREQILDDLVRELDNNVPNIAVVTQYMMSQTGMDKNVSVISLKVESDESVTEGSDRYKAELGLYVLTDQTRTGIEGLVDGIKTYIKSADIDNVLELLYVSHEPVEKPDTDVDRFSFVKIILSLLYKGTTTDTAANAHPDWTINGYMAVSHYKTYALMVSGSTTFQALGTNVYDSHRNANIEMPEGSGSISVDIIGSAVVDDQGGIYANELLDSNVIPISIRGHYPTGTPNRVMEAFMYSIVNELRSNVDLGHDYRLLVNEPFITAYNQEFEESGTVGSEIIFDVNKTWSYEQG